MTPFTPLVESAAGFACLRHQGQLRKCLGRVPYIAHPAEVAELVTLLGGSDVAVAAAWLHDTVEDCPPTTIRELTARFGGAVAAVVAELTDDKQLSKPERKQRQIESAPRKSPAAALVKLADKTANVRSVGHTPPVDWSRGRRIAYLDWAAQVVAALPASTAPFRPVFDRALRDSRRMVW
ncbi:MAG: HD domain-containing protein [Paracoccaceae bacterium]